MVYVIDRIDKKFISLNICSLNGTSGVKGGKCLFACCPFFPLFRERPCMYKYLYNTIHKRKVI